MSRFAHALVFALAAVFVNASGAHAFEAKTALRKIFESAQDHVGALAAEALGTRQQSASQATAMASECSYAARGAPKLLNGPINITQKGLQHVLDRHTASGIAKFAGKSKFNAGENIADLIRSGTQMPGVRQANGRIARTFDAGREIGFDRNLGQQTNIMTIITEADGALVTAFPGLP